MAYALVVDTMTGKRVLMADMVKNREKFSDYLIAAYEKGDWEFDFFLDEERAAGILNFGSMTEEAFVVMPGANCYEPIFLPWDEVEDAVYTGDIK